MMKKYILNFKPSRRKLILMLILFFVANSCLHAQTLKVIDTIKNDTLILQCGERISYHSGSNLGLKTGRMDSLKQDSLYIRNTWIAIQDLKTIAPFNGTQKVFNVLLSTTEFVAWPCLGLSGLMTISGAIGFFEDPYMILLVGLGIVYAKLSIITIGVSRALKIDISGWNGKWMGRSKIIIE